MPEFIGQYSTDTAKTFAFGTQAAAVNGSTDDVKPKSSFGFGTATEAPKDETPGSFIVTTMENEPGLKCTLFSLKFQPTQVQVARVASCLLRPIGWRVRLTISLLLVPLRLGFIKRSIFSFLPLQIIDYDFFR